MVERSRKASCMLPPRDDETLAVERVTLESGPARPPFIARSSPPVRAVPRSITATLLPGERVTFGSTPHPIVLVRPLVLMLAVLIAFAVAFQRVPFAAHPYVEALGAVAALGALVAFVRGIGAFAGVRAIATNRRIFVIRGIVFRRVAPLGNTELASATLVQGIFGRMYGFGTIDAPHAGKRIALFRDMRDAATLYRECQAVANGVDGDTWTPAVRQTIIP
jgi:hypothetical protein